MWQGKVLSFHIAAVASAPIQSVLALAVVLDSRSIFVYLERYGFLAFRYSMFYAD